MNVKLVLMSEDAIPAGQAARRAKASPDSLDARSSTMQSHGTPRMILSADGANTSDSSHISRHKSALSVPISRRPA